MMADLIDRQTVLEELNNEKYTWQDYDMMEYALNHVPAVDAVPRDVLEQIRWERDIAIEQLNSYGVSFGEKADCKKVVRCKNCKFARESKDAFGCGDLEPLCECVYMTWPHRWHEYCSFGGRREDDG